MKHMKEKGEELLVINKKVFFLILAAIAVFGIVVGYTIGYITTPVKEVYVQKSNETEKTVLPQVQQPQVQQPQMQQSKVQQPQSQQNQSQVQEKENVKIVQEAEATEKTQTEKHTEPERTLKTQKHGLKKVAYRKTMYTVQLGAFQEITNAEALMKKLKDAGISAYIVKEDLYKIRTGYYKRFRDAQKASQVIGAKGFENFIIKIKKLKGG